MTKVLRWVYNENVVDEGTFVAPKGLTLEALNADPVPQEFQVFQVYSSLLRQVLSHLRVPDRKPGPRFVPMKVTRNLYHGDRMWQLPAPRGFRKSAAFLFGDDSGNESGVVYSSRLGTPSFEMGGQVGAAVPAGPVPVGVGGAAEVRITIQFAVDPTLVAEVLTRQALVDHVLNTLTEDYMVDIDDDVHARIELEFSDLPDLLLANYSPPETWNAVLSAETIYGDAGSVASLDLSLTGLSEGTGYYAVSFFDPENPEFGETTDVWAFMIDAAGVVTAWPYPEEIAIQAFVEA